jgi:rod shape-determining protein MreC
LTDLKVPLTWTAAVAVVIATVIVVALLLGDRRETVQGQAEGVTKNVVDTVSQPVSGAIAAPGRWTGGGLNIVRNFLLTYQENDRLRDEVKRLHDAQDQVVALKNLNDRYRSLLGLRTDPPIPMVTALMVTDSRGPFANTRLANVGAEHGVQVGNPVMAEDGLVGRIVGVARGASRVLLLTDIASRTPVLVARTNARAILTGDGGPNPKLEFVRGLNSVKDGDMVLTSGDGGLYPRGLPVGVAAKDFRGVWRVRLYSDRAAIDFVRILVFDDFSQMVSQAQLAQSAMPALTPEEQAQLEAARTAAAKPASPSVGGPGASPASPTAVSPPPPAPAPHVKSAGSASDAAQPKKSVAKAKAPSKPKIPRGQFKPDEVLAQPAPDQPGGGGR